jgi:hypothetical protein
MEDALRLLHIGIVTDGKDPVYPAQILHGSINDS